MKILKFNLMAVAVLIVTAIQISFVSCSDDPGVDNYFTSKKEYAADFLKNRPEYSDYVKILQRATGAGDRYRLLDLLGTYGSYTVFAPNNDAIAKYCKEKNYATVDDIKKEECDTIALNSIIPKQFFITDFSQGTYSVANMLDRYLKIDSKGEEQAEGGEAKLVCYINNTSKLVQMDDSVSNGVVHTINSVISTSNDMIGDVFKKDDNIKIFNKAFEMTKLKDSLFSKYLDESYSVSSDSTGWTNNALVYHTASECDNIAYPEKRFYMFTAFIETDSVLKQYGINNVEDLNAKAHAIYDPIYPEDKDITDYTNRRNALNRFVAYHFLPFKADYYHLTAIDGDASVIAQSPSIAQAFARRKIDVADWYETCMPFSIMKFSFPSGAQAGLYINRRGVQSRADTRGVKVRGAKVIEPENTNAPLNGLYYYVDDIIAYDENTQKVVLDERMRIDASTLSPDFMTSGARGIYPRSGGSGPNGRYANSAGTNYNALTNNCTCYGFKGNYTENFKFDDKTTHIHIRNRYMWFWSYEGDEMIVKGRFDFTIKLPPVPAGDYELRFMTCVGFTSRGIMQAYEGTNPDNLTPCGIPFDMRPGGSTLFGYQSDQSLGDDDAIQAFDKSIHNNGWMKGPGCWVSLGNTWSDINNSFRNQDNTIRKVITRFHTNGKEDHYLRVQQKMESSENELNFDFIEIVPSTVFNNEYYPEDKW